MKKFLAMMMVVMMVAVMFVACGEKTPAGNDGEVKGETYDTGAFTVLVPSGWKAFPLKDIFGSDPEANRVDAIQIVKGGENDYDILTKPYVQINYYGEDSSMMEPQKSWYDAAEDVEPMTLGGFTWKGFTATTSGLTGEQKNAILWTEEVNDQQFQASFYLEAGDNKITLQDADVQAILSSVAGAGAAAATAEAAQ